MGRKLGIDFTTEAPWGTHFTFFYREQRDLVSLAPCFFKAGLENNEFGLWVTYELTSRDAEQILSNSLPNFANYLKNKQMEIIPYKDFYFQDGNFDPQEVLNKWVVIHDQAIARGYDGIRCLADLSWVRTDEWDNVEHYEKKLNTLMSGYHMLIVCPYSQDTNPAKIIKVLLNHQFGLIHDADKFDIIETSKLMLNGLVTGKEIVPRQKLENHLAFLQKMEAIGRLAGGVAHDFNNLLAIIMGEAELIKARLSQEDPLYAGIIDILEAADKGGALTRQLLLFSRNQVPEIKIIDLKVLIAGLGNMIRSVIGEDIELNVISVPNLEHVKLGPVQMEQVIMNLAINARDAMPHGGQLFIELANEHLAAPNLCYFGIMPPGDYVTLTVTDTGEGMSPEVQAHLFEPFFTTKDPGRGTGLGLPVVFGVIMQSGGYFQIKSKVGEGTAFKIYLPKVEDPLNSLTAKAEPQVTLKGSETILLVEDNDSLRSVICRFLRQYGYQVLEAHDAAEALLIGEGHHGPIHLLLTDLVMPLMSGRELAERLSPLHPEMKLLYMSGYAESAVLRRGVSEKSMPFIGKPFKPADLLRKLREILVAPFKG